MANWNRLVTLVTVASRDSFQLVEVGGDQHNPCIKGRGGREGSLASYEPKNAL